MQDFKPTKLLMFDLNWSMWDEPHEITVISSAHDWAFLDPKAYFDWHIETGNNAIFLQAYTQGGYAFYPSNLGPLAAVPGSSLLPEVYRLTREAGLPFWSYMSVGADYAVNVWRPDWVIPGSKKNWPQGFLGPETPWTDLLCDRLREFLSRYPADLMLLDWFCYGDLASDFHVQPAWFVDRPFREIIGRDMPQDAADITPEESLAYKREVLARQFYRIRDAVKDTSPSTEIVFSPPYWGPADPLWVDHPMVNESDGLLAEFAKDETMEWLLSIRKPHQRVVATPMCCSGFMDADTMKKWVARGCDLNGYVWATPPHLEVHRSKREGWETVRRAFHEIPG